MVDLNTNVSGPAAVGIGYMSQVDGNRSVGIGSELSGTKNTASGDYSVAIGAAAQVQQISATAIVNKLMHLRIMH